MFMTLGSESLREATELMSHSQSFDLVSCAIENCLTER